jgi:hypothetical protein
MVDFDRVALWNPKLEGHDAPPPDRLAEGQSFWIRYGWRGKTHQVRATVETLKPPFRFTVRYAGGDLGREGWGREVVRISPFQGATLLGREVHMHDPRIPRWARLVIGLLARFGTPRGESDLQAVRRLVLAEDEA